MRDLVAAVLALARAAADATEGLQEEGLDVVGLQAARLGALHVGADAVHAAGVHQLGCQRTLFEQLVQPGAVEGILDDRRQLGAHVGLLAVADGLDQQVAQRAAVELQFAEHVENLAAERLAGLLQLFEQALVDVALARVGGDQVPEVADLGLADAVDAAEALFEAVGVPGQVVVDHEVGALEVDALAGGVGREQHAHLRVVAEGLLRGAALLAAQSAVDGYDSRLAPEAGGDALVQIVERVAVLGEDDQLLLRRGDRLRDRA